MGEFRRGATDEHDRYAAADKAGIRDPHSTILHLMGPDHEGLTFRRSGRDFRLTDDHGRVVDEILA